MRISALVLATAFCTPATLSGAFAQGEVKEGVLRYEAIERWDIVLPEEAWRPLGDALALASHRFAIRQNDRGQLLIDTDGDGTTERRVSRAEEFVELRVREDGFRYALRVRKGRGHWDWSPSCALSGRLGATRIRLIDADGDGYHDRYGSDALVVGRRPFATYLSRVILVGGAVRRFEVSEGGTKVSSSPYEGPLGKLDVTSRFRCEGELVAAIFQSGSICLDLAAPRVGSIPAGRYYLVSGQVERGNHSAHISAGRLEPVELTAGAERVLEWGGPLSAEFTFAVQGDQLTVHPHVGFYGTAGESYDAFEPLVKSPKLWVLDGESGRVVQYGRFGGCCGGGFSAWVTRVPRGTSLKVVLEHERALFGMIRGEGTQRFGGGWVSDR